MLINVYLKVFWLGYFGIMTRELSSHFEGIRYLSYISNATVHDFIVFE